MFGRSYRLTSIAGIPVGVSPLWLVIVAIMTVGLGSGYYPDAVPAIAPVAAYGLGLLSVLLLFASVLAHEFGHALVARRHGLGVLEIDLWLLGGVAKMRGRPQRAADELRYAVAGPLVTLGVTLVFGVLALALQQTAPRWLRAVVDYQAVLNLGILCLNMLPAFPLDGGRVVRAILWKLRGDLLWATELASRIGVGFGWLLGGLGLVVWLSGYIDGLWLVMIGGFLSIASTAERVHEERVAAVSGLTIGALMTANPTSVRSEASCADVLHQLQGSGHDAFPVIGHDGHALGLLTTGALDAALQDGYATLVADIADADQELLVSAEADAATLLDSPAFARAHHAVVVTADGRPVGILAESDILRAIQVRRLTPTAGAGHPAHRG